MISLQKVSKQFGKKVLFGEADFQVHLSDRIGLIGPNGSGKSTLFSLILGEQSPDNGLIEKNKNMVVGCLKQEEEEGNLSCTLIEEMVNKCPTLTRLKERILFLQAEVSQEENPEKIQTIMQHLGEHQTEFESRGGYDLEYQAKRILFGLGFGEEDLNRALREFSGGWRMRICLAKLLLQEPDLLLLDEPTNHLDLESVLWLEEFIRAYQGSVIIISHDRKFLNRTVTRIVEIDQQLLNQYKGNYDDFIEQKKVRDEISKASYKNQQRKIEATERFIEKFRYKASKARQVQSRVKSLNKMEKVQLDQEASRFSIKIPSPPRSGKIVLDLKNIEKGYERKVVYKGLNLTIKRGDRIALVGPNGSGKSTLLKIMAGVLDIDRGEVSLGHNVSRAYFAQHQLEILNPELTVLEEIDPCLDQNAGISSRSFLGAFLFMGDDVFKKVSVLSGGEKNRLVLAKMIISSPNFLLLDEPTNHLDIPSRDCLQDALSQYQGTICMISHDRLFINQLANHIIRIENGQLETFLGNYDEYQLQMQDRKKISATERISPAKPGLVKSREQKRKEAEKRNEKYRRLNPIQKESEGIQKELNSILERMDQLNKLFTDPGFYETEGFTKKLKEYKELEAQNEWLTDRWTELEEQKEAIEKECNEDQ